MKNLKKVITISFMIIGVMLIGCFENSEKSKQEIRDNIEENEAYKLELDEYRFRIAEQITTNENSIIAFRSRIVNQKKEARADYEKKINDLNNKNTDLKMRLDAFNADNKESWELFKVEFGRDMDELGNALRDFTINSQK
jgi:dynactin complex subunit